MRPPGPFEIGIILFTVLLFFLIAGLVSSKPSKKRRDENYEDDVFFCDNCDTKIDKEDKCCRGCGEALEDASDTSEIISNGQDEDGFFCDNCGDKIYKDDKYCKSCGLELEDDLDAPEDISIEQDDKLYEKFRTEFENDSDIHKNVPVGQVKMEIGKHCGWPDIIGQIFRVLEFDRAGTTIGPDDNVKAKSLFKPYGYLIVESPIFNQPSKLPIVHRDDFILASRAFDDPNWTNLSEDWELLVTYVPKQKLPGGAIGVHHGLHYVVTPLGTLERYYDFDDGAYMANPMPEKLFGTLAWDGLLRVQVNINPDI